MKPRSALSLLLALAGLLAPAARAQPPLSAQLEINMLLGYVEKSGCAFYRNGTWFDAKAAQTHLRDKYQYLSSRNSINTAEDFIKRAATESSFSGQPYAVKCNGGATETSSQWLLDELIRLRTALRKR